MKTSSVVTYTDEKELIKFLYNSDTEDYDFQYADNIPFTEFVNTLSKLIDFVIANVTPKPKVIQMPKSEVVSKIQPNMVNQNIVKPASTIEEDIFEEIEQEEINEPSSILDTLSVEQIKKLKDAGVLEDLLMGEKKSINQDLNKSPLVPTKNESLMILPDDDESTKIHKANALAAERLTSKQVVEMAYEENDDGTFKLDDKGEKIPIMFYDYQKGTWHHKEKNTIYTGRMVDKKVGDLIIKIPEELMNVKSNPEPFKAPRRQIDKSLIAGKKLLGQVIISGSDK